MEAIITSFFRKLEDGETRPPLKQHRPQPVAKKRPVGRPRKHAPVAPARK